MRLRKWLGMFSNASPYLLPAGANRLQVNLQTTIPGQMQPRGGVWPVSDALLSNNFSVGLAGSAQIISLYRGVRTGQLDYLIACVTDGSTTTIRNLTTSTTLKTGTFGPQSPVSICQDRHGTFYFFQGYGAKPQRWSGVDTSQLVDLGLPAPDIAPGASRDGSAGSGYYIERVNVTDGGAAYWTQPTITVTGTLGTGGTPARLRAIVEGGVVTAVSVLEPGSNYVGPVTLSFDESAAATNTFAATVTLASSAAPGQFGMSNISPSAITGSLTADHTVAVGGNNKTVTYFLEGNTTGTNIASKAAVLSNNLWSATDIPILRAADNKDSAGRVSVVFSNAAFQYTVGPAYGLNAITSTNDGWNPSTNEAGLVLHNASRQYAQPPDVRNGYPNVLVVDASGNLLYRSPLRWEGVIEGEDQWWFIYTDGNGAVVQVFLASRNSLGPFAPSDWGTHPDAQKSQYALPIGIGRRLDNNDPIISNTWRVPYVVNPRGSGYPASGFTARIARLTNNGTVQSSIGTEINFSTIVVGTVTDSVNLPRSLVSWSVTSPGTSWAAGDTGYIQFASRKQDSNAAPAPASYAAAQKLTLTAVQTGPGQTSLTGAVGSVNVINGGDKLLVPPTIEYQGTGYGLVLRSSLTGQSITKGETGITVVNGGAGFLTPPTLSIRTGGAQATAIMRPTMVGKYQCAYRYYDGSVPASLGGPIYSSFSDIAEFDAGPGLDFLSTNAFNWSLNPIAAPPARATGVELWRTSSDQALVFYRVAVLPSLATGTVFADRISDEQLFNPDRDQYAAMPVVLPNGELNAYRFGQPRTDMAVCVAFQDRLFYGVSTSGEKINSIYYSEFDEFESCPDINEVTIQQNVRQPDQITALAPFGGQLVAFQRMHCYSLTYLQDPSEDGNLQLLAFRGCFNQQCWEIYDGLIYAVDEYGVYTLSGSGQIEDLSVPIRDLFENGLAIHSAGGSDNFIHLKIDPSTKILRVFCTPPGETISGNFHSSALCYSLETKTWWIERYPRFIACGTHLKTQQNRIQCVYGSTSRVVLLDHLHSDFQNRTVRSFDISSSGSGYTQPPTIVVNTATGQGGVFQAVLDDNGGIKAIVVKSGGTNYANGSTFTTSGGGGTGCTGTITSSNSTVSSGVATGITSIPWWFQTGNMELITDRESSRDGGQKSRAIALTYKPTALDRNVHLRLYYNNSSYPRNNFARRDRGTGFVEDITGNSSVLNMKSDRTNIGAESTGVSIARFAGRGFDDSVQTDRHVSVEISSDPPLFLGANQEVEANAPVIYEVDVQGVQEQG